MKGLSGGYAGLVVGEPEVGFKVKGAAIRMDGTLDIPGLIALAKGVNAKLK